MSQWHVWARSFHHGLCVFKDYSIQAQHTACVQVAEFAYALKGASRKTRRNVIGACKNSTAIAYRADCASVRDAISRTERTY